MSTTKRTYVQRQRAERSEQTRQRIIEAAVGLHLETGPAAAAVSEIARRADVERATVYNHFPDAGSLYAACSAHWRAQHPSPDPQAWLVISDPLRRAHALLRDLYGWYRQTAPMTAHVLRDAESLPALHDVIAGGLLRYLDRATDVLAEPFLTTNRQPGGPQRTRIERAAAVAVSPAFWQTLEPIGDESAAELGAGLVQLASRPR